MKRIRAFTMPKWGIEMTEGTVAEWHVAEGDSFANGDTLCLIETDKIVNEVDAEFDGTLRKVVAAAGETLPVGALLGVFAIDDVSDTEIDEFISHFEAANIAVAANAGESKADAGGTSNAVAETATPTVTTDRPISPEALKYAQANNLDLTAVAGSGRGGRITYQDVQQFAQPAARPDLLGPMEVPARLDRHFASPFAKRIAAKHQIDLSKLTGTGPRGRISRADVESEIRSMRQTGAARTPFVPAENHPQIETMDKVRVVIARRLTEAKSTIPHFYLRSNVRMDALLAMRKAQNLVLQSRASINDYVIMAVSKALVMHPKVNIQVHGDAVHSFPHADVAVAVATESGLVTPILRNADGMRIDTIAQTTKALIAKAQSGKLSYEDIDGGTFTISNLGMFGIEQFDAIINPPQGAILAVGGIVRSWGEDEDGHGRFESRMALSMSCDHRAIDGAVGAAFVADVKTFLEDPDTLLTDRQ